MSRPTTAAPRRTAARRGYRRRRAGLSLVEAMIALGITAALLTAVAVAYSASTAAIETNDEFFRASQVARVSVNKIVADVRQCLSGTISEDGDELELVTVVKMPDGVHGYETCTYRFDDDAGTLTLTVGADPLTATTYTMARNVTGGGFVMSGDGKSIAVNVAVNVGGHEIALSGSGVPRRWMTFE